MKTTLNLLVPWRLLIFALLGPPIGLCFAMWVLLPVFEFAVGGRPLFDWHQIVLVPLSYLLGLVPACVVAVFDAFLAGRHFSYRSLWTALFGFAASFLPLLSSLTAGLSTARSFCCSAWSARRRRPCAHGSRGEGRCGKRCFECYRIAAAMLPPSTVVTSAVVFSASA